MTDSVDRVTRSRMMSGIRNKNTKPEIVVRKLLHAAGLRYRLHRRDLPGIPDIVLPKYHAVIFTHGCFWHMHEGCRYAKLPKSNSSFWKLKLESNRSRDERNVKLLLDAGWRVLVIWECSIRIAELSEQLGHTLISWILRQETYSEYPSKPVT